MTGILCANTYLLADGTHYSLVMLSVVIIKQYDINRKYMYLCSRNITFKVFISMEDKSLELLTEEGRRFYDEFTRCETMDEIEELGKKWSKLNESQENNVIPHYDMTLEELDKKYGLVSHEEVWKNVLNKC